MLAIRELVIISNLGQSVLTTSLSKVRHINLATEMTKEG